MRKLLLILLLVNLAACTPLISVSINNGGDGSKSIKGESDQTATPKTSIPVSVIPK